jgi:hypothetical protein
MYIGSSTSATYTAHMKMLVVGSCTGAKDDAGCPANAKLSIVRICRSASLTDSLKTSSLRRERRSIDCPMRVITLETSAPTAAEPSTSAGIFGGLVSIIMVTPRLGVDVLGKRSEGDFKLFFDDRFTGRCVQLAKRTGAVVSLHLRLNLLKICYCFSKEQSCTIPADVQLVPPMNGITLHGVHVPEHFGSHGLEFVALLHCGIPSLGKTSLDRFCVLAIMHSSKGRLASGMTIPVTRWGRLKLVPEPRCSFTYWKISRRLRVQSPVFVLELRHPSHGLVVAEQVSEGFIELVEADGQEHQEHPAEVRG